MEDNDEEFPERETPTGTSSSECSSNCSESDISEETNIKQVYDGHSANFSTTEVSGNPVVMSEDTVSAINSYSVAADDVRSEERPHSWHAETNREENDHPRMQQILAVSNIPQTINIANPLRQVLLFNNSDTNQQCTERLQSIPTSAIQRRPRHAPCEYRHTRQATHLVEESLPHSNLPPCIRIFVTYSTGIGESSKRFICEMKELVRILGKHRFQVDFDRDRESIAVQRLNIDDWIDKCYKWAKWIIVCISPAYPEDVEEATGACAGTSQLNARYIYDKIRNEYKNNQCQNRPVIPVTFTNSGATNVHVPHCMQTTFVYQYPNETDALLDTLYL